MFYCRHCKFPRWKKNYIQIRQSEKVNTATFQGTKAVSVADMRRSSAREC